MGPANALDILIYHNNYAYTDTKSGLEGQGHTVTGSTSTTVASASTLANYDVVIDQLYNNNCGSTCRANYDTYVENGGHLIIVGENTNFPTRNSNIVSLIENKFGGTLDLQTNGMSFGGTTYGSSNNTVNTSVSDADDGGQYVAGSEILNTSDGLWLAKTSGGAIIWMMWRGDDLPSGYTGSVTVTFDINQFQSNYDSDATFEYVDDVMYYGENGSMATAAYTSSISSAQTLKVNNARGVTHSGNGIYINQVGSNNTLNVTQDGNDNLIAGPTTTTNTIVKSDITGNNNTTTMTQRGDNNAILFDITGDYNSTTVDQGGASGADDNRILMDINGDYNTISSTQTHNNGVGNNGHFLAIDIDGDSNNLLTSQTNDGDKKAFISLQGDDNDIDLYQQGTGSHYVEIATGSDQTVDVTQDGSGNHNASISMTGYSATLDLTQDSSTNQTYSINQNCLNANGCGTTTVTQQ